MSTCGSSSAFRLFVGEVVPLPFVNLLSCDEDEIRRGAGCGGSGRPTVCVREPFTFGSCDNCVGDCSTNLSPTLYPVYANTEKSLSYFRECPYSMCKKEI